MDTIDSLFEFATGSKRAFREAAAKGDHEAVVSALGEGQDVESASDYGATALHKAAASGQLEMVRLLLTHGANAGAMHKGQLTPLQEARLAGHTQVVSVLLEWKRRQLEEKRERRLVRAQRVTRSKSMPAGADGGLRNKPRKSRARGGRNSSILVIGR